MSGDLVRLRDVTLDDADLLDAWAREGPSSPFSDLGQEVLPLPRDVIAAGPGPPFRPRTSSWSATHWVPR